MMEKLDLGEVISRARGPQRAPPPPASAVAGVDERALEADLKEAIEGEVRFDAGSRALYAADASNYRQIPIGVVIPRTIDDVVETVRVCRRHGAPFLSRGGGTSLAGQCCNVAVVVDFTKYLGEVLDVDPSTRTARVQPGVVLDKLNAAAEEYHLTFGPDPATHSRCVLGGMIGNNSCGAHAQMAGPVSHNVLALDVLTYDGLRMQVGKTSDEELRSIIAEGGRRGAIYAALRDLRDRYADEIRRRYPPIPRRISGYNLNALLPEYGFDVARALVGTEGTCVTILEAKLKLLHSPPHRGILLVGYPDVYTAGDHALELAERFEPLALEGFDHVLVRNVEKETRAIYEASEHLQSTHGEYLSLFPRGTGFLMLELGGETKEELEERGREVMARLARDKRPPTTNFYSDPKDVAHVWKVRESGLGATARVPGEPDTWPGWEDSAVPPTRLGDYLRGMRRLYDKYGYNAALYGHFGQACVHTRIDFDLASTRGIQQYRSFIEEAVDLCVSFGGSLSGEHGDGQSRAEFLPRMFGETLVRAMAEFKRVWDPDWKMNPGKVVHPNAIDQDLRLGADYRPWQPDTHFRFPDDDGKFSRAALRCVGVGKCRRDGGEGTMCPSYMVTREEMHSTRGRAHLLFEMMNGQVVRDAWRDDHVKESLDLCLSCKGCKGDCPVNVDLATYKAEFLAHYYKRRPRPMPAYAMGLMMFWAPIASLAPGVVNFFTQTPPFKEALELVGGISLERDIPRFAPESFQHWLRRRSAPAIRAGRPRVLLWPDTWNNYFFPETAYAALEALEGAGFAVDVPQAHLCCGRPLYDFGMLPTAKWMLRRTMRLLEEDIEEGVPIVGLEPSCVSVFRDELRNLYPTWPLATKLRRQTFLLSEFLERYAKDVPLPKLQRKAVVHGHCHHKSLFKMEDETKVLKRLGIDPEMPETGCCGMAGAFGYERGDKYEVSIKCGERVLLPKVREAPKSTLIVANGFSCREQIAQTTDRKALHLAQLIRMAQVQGPHGPEGELPERGWVTGSIGDGGTARPALRVGLAVGTLALGSALLLPPLLRQLRARAGRRPLPPGSASGDGSGGAGESGTNGSGAGGGS